MIHYIYNFINMNVFHILSSMSTSKTTVLSYALRDVARAWGGNNSTAQLLPGPQAASFIPTTRENRAVLPVKPVESDG